MNATNSEARTTKPQPTAASTSADGPGAKAGKAAAAPAPQARLITPFLASKGSLAQFRRNCWVVFAPDSMPVSDFETPALWTHVGRGYAMFDRVEILQSTRWTEAIVCDVGHGFANVRVLQSLELPARREASFREVPAGYSIRQGRAEEEPFVVTRLKDGHVMNRDQNHQSYEDALRWLLDLNIW